MGENDSKLSLSVHAKQLQPKRVRQFPGGQSV
jgi:hypothetical protein